MTLEINILLFLHNQPGLTRGNFSTHISKLEEQGFISVTKEYVGRKPTTIYQLTQFGKEALEIYRNQKKYSQS